MDNEVAELLTISRTKVYELVASGQSRACNPATTTKEEFVDDIMLDAVEGSLSLWPAESRNVA